MSIVEKAIQKKNEPGARRAGGRQADAAASGEVIRISDQLGEHGFLLTLESPELAREFRLLKRPLLARVFGLSRSESAKGNLVLIASDLPGAGKSFISLNLAVSIAQEQMTNVLLIDADPMRGQVTGVLGQDGKPGLLQILEDPDIGCDAVKLQTDIPSFQFIPAGQIRSNATELLGGRRMSELLASLDDPDTVVLIDSPPLLITAEGRVLADQVNHTLVVVESGRSTSANVESVLKVLGDVQSSISFVLNKAPKSEVLPDQGYSY